jgi:beta-lactamase class C
MRLLALLLVTVLLSAPARATALSDSEIHHVVAQQLEPLLRGAGAAVAVRTSGRTSFLNFGVADRARNSPVTSDSLFNLASVGKVFDALLLSLLALDGEVRLDDPVAKYIAELKGGTDIGDIRLGELITNTSGLSIPQELPPWPPAQFTLPKFLSLLKHWEIHPDHRRGLDYLYSHAGFMLLHVALERRFGMAYAALLEQRLLQPLALSSTILPMHGAAAAGTFSPALRRRLVQGYGEDGKPVGRRGDMPGIYHWPGTSQMFSSARDLATVVALNLGEGEPLLRQAAALTHRKAAPIDTKRSQAHAWEIRHEAVTVIDKNGGLSNGTSYIGLVPSHGLGIVTLLNRGWLDGREIGLPILLRLATRAPA